MSNKRRMYDAEERYEVLIKQRRRCSICGKALNTKNMTLDHYIPLSKGGRNINRNIFITCFECNIHKGNKIYDPEVIYKYASEGKIEWAKREHNVWVQYNLKTIAKRTKIILVYTKETLIEIPFDRNLYLQDKNNLRILKRVENRYKVKNIDLIDRQIVIPIGNIEINEPYYDTKTKSSVLLVTDRSKLNEAKKNILEFRK